MSAFDADNDFAGFQLLPDSLPQSTAASMGLRQRELLINSLKKENFGLKMRVYFLTETLHNLSPEGIKDIVNEHAELKALAEDLRLELRQRDAEGIRKSALTAAQLEETDALYSLKLDDALRQIAAKEALLDSERQEWLIHIQNIEDEYRAKQSEHLSQSGPISGPSKASVECQTDPHVLPDESKAYKDQINEFQSLSLCTADEMAFLKKELLSQTSKLKALEDRCRTDTVHRKLVVSSMSSSSLRLDSNRLSPSSNVASVSQSVPNLESHIINNGFTQDDENKQRFIAELKIRNKLLLQVNQQLGFVLKYSQYPQINAFRKSTLSGPIRDFKDLKTSIQNMLRAARVLETQHDLLLDEQRLFSTKVSAMESKLTRRASQQIDADCSGDKPLLAVDTTQYEQMRLVMLGLQQNFEQTRLELATEREGATRRINDLINVNKYNYRIFFFVGLILIHFFFLLDLRKLEDDLLQCSKTLALFEQDNRLKKVI